MHRIPLLFSKRSFDKFTVQYAVLDLGLIASVSPIYRFPPFTGFLFCGNTEAVGVLGLEAMCRFLPLIGFPFCRKREELRPSYNVHINDWPR